MHKPATPLKLALRLCLLAGVMALGCSEEVEPRADGASVAMPGGEVSQAVLGALRLRDPLERASQLSKLLMGLAPRAIPQVLDAFDQQFVESGEFEWVLLAAWWTRNDPAGAWEWARSHRAGRRPEVVSTVLRETAARDPQQALRALADLRGNPKLYEAGLLAVVTGWNESGSPGLLEHLVGMEIGGLRQRALALLTRRMVMRDANEATRWAEALPDDLERRFKLQAFRRVAAALALWDPVAAAAWAEKHADAPYGDGLYRHAVTTAWVERDPQAVVDWLATLPAGAARDAALREAFRRWMAKHPGDATAWMAGAERESWRQPALEVLALRTAREDPLRALELAALLSDDDKQMGTIVKIGRFWLRQEPGAAQAWLDTAELPSETREKILGKPAAHGSPRG
jgi:hypothetical protein